MFVACHTCVGEAFNATASVFTSWSESLIVRGLGRFFSPASAHTLGPPVRPRACVKLREKQARGYGGTGQEQKEVIGGGKKLPR